jgi:hypothetical protein
MDMFTYMTYQTLPHDEKTLFKMLYDLVLLTCDNTSKYINGTHIRELFEFN